jgi:circadian clock protein KaiB
MSEYVFDLYIAGHTARSRRAVRNMTELCDELLPDRHTLKIINVLEHPQAAEEAKIITTPTLVQHSPHPGRRIVGDLSDRQALERALGVELDGQAGRMDGSHRPAEGSPAPGRKRDGAAEDRSATVVSRTGRSEGAE